MTGGPAGRAPTFEDRVGEVILRLRPGEVTTYGEIAEEAGYPGAARAVGGVLARSDGLPWWRVVTSTGRLVPGYEAEHASRLRAEGVPVDGGRVRRREGGRNGTDAATVRGRGADGPR